MALTLPSVTYLEHAPVTYTGDLLGPDGWERLLDVVRAVHDMEEGLIKNSIYYGIINSCEAHTPCPGTVGMGWIGSPTSVGFTGFGGGRDASETMTHEMGHNFGRRHVAGCGNPAHIDENYPYPGGSIGQWGLDVFTGVLKNPAVFRDYMTYCSNYWTSDYTYKEIFDFRRGLLTFFSVSEPADTLYIRGLIKPGGKVWLGPIYRQTLKHEVVSPGSYRIDLTDDEGNVLSRQSFNPTAIGDSGTSGFGFFVPYIEGIAGIRLYEREHLVYERMEKKKHRIVEPRYLSARRLRNGRVSVEWSANTRDSVVHRIRISRDGGENWEVLSMDLKNTNFTLASELLNGAKDVLIEVQATDGLHIKNGLVRLLQ